MEHLPQTTGKGVLMFAKRRQRMDELSTEQEEMRQKGKAVDAVVKCEAEIAKPSPQEERTQIPPDAHFTQQQQYREQQILQHPANGLNDPDLYQGLNVSRPLVPNRTAKPFLGGHIQGQKHFSTVRSVSSPTTRKTENIFKVPVPVNTTPQLWSPTADIIASRDERIAIPAIRTGILPESKRRGVTKSDLKGKQQSQTKGQLIDSVPEEDFLSLGAEACNFMQAPKIKQRNPPPVLPKPVINTAHPPWSAEGRGSRSALSASNSRPAFMDTQVKKTAQPNPPQPMRKSWTSLPSQPVATSKKTLPSTQIPAVFQATKTMPVSLHAGSSQSKMSWTKSQNEANSVSSCPPQYRGTYGNVPKGPSAFPKGYSDAGACEGLNLKGKGAELFARRQTRMEKFVVDDKTVQANKARSPSPPHSMPSLWKYSSNVRAPPPASYNPILSPLYPLAAVKQPPSAISQKTHPKTIKEKAKPPAKHLNTLDVMKHQPYQLDSSLFSYNSSAEATETSSRLCAVSPSGIKQNSAQAPVVLHAQCPSFEPSAMLASSPNSIAKSSKPVKQIPSKASVKEINRSSLFFPQRQSSLPPSSPISTPSVHPMRKSLTRQFSWVEQPKQPISSWEEVVQSPFGLDRVKLTGTTHRKSLPATVAECNRGACFGTFGGSQEKMAIRSGKSTTHSFSAVPQNPVLYGLPFHPEKHLGPGNRYNKSNSMPRNFTFRCDAQSHRVSQKL